MKLSLEFNFEILEVELKFSHYSHYEFYLSGFTQNGIKITAVLGGDRDSLYYLSLTAETKFSVQFLIQYMNFEFTRQKDGSYFGKVKS
jgi:hypothetical protein